MNWELGFHCGGFEFGNVLGTGGEFDHWAGQAGGGIEGAVTPYGEYPASK